MAGWVGGWVVPPPPLRYLPKGTKEKFYKAPKLICIVTLWHRFVVQLAPQGGEPSLHDRSLPLGGTSLTKRGRLQGGGGV